MADRDPIDLKARNRRTAGAVAGVFVAMVGLSYASVPLYDLFCRVTGFGGTPQVADAAPTDVAEATRERVMTIRFDAATAPDLGWSFKPVERTMKVRVGEPALAYYTAHNDESVPVVGTAGFNVTPEKAGLHFAKVECFCFTEQVLKPGESVEMPVNFFIDPDIMTDPKMDDVTTITLSYTFYRSPDQSALAEQQLSAVSEENGAGTANN